MLCVEGKECPLPDAFGSQCTEIQVPSEHGCTLTQLCYGDSGGGIKLSSSEGGNGSSAAFLTWQTTGNTLTLRESSLTGESPGHCRKFVFLSGSILPGVSPTRYFYTNEAKRSLVYSDRVRNAKRFFFYCVTLYRCPPFNSRDDGNGGGVRVVR